MLCNVRKRRVYTFFVIFIIFTTALYFQECYSIDEDISVKASSISTTRRAPGPGVRRLAPMMRGRHTRGRVTWCRPLTYLSPRSGHPRTALASFPGAGNTWVRLLVQQMSGTWTGSIYSDGDLRSNGFPGEYKASDRVMVVKTHEWGPHTR